MVVGEMIRGPELDTFIIKNKALMQNNKSADFFAEFMALAPTIPKLAELITKIGMKGRATIQFVSDDSVPTGGEWEASERVIRIDSQLKPLKLLDTLIFEFFNAVNPNSDSELLNPRNFNSGIEYAYACEHSEYYQTQLPFEVLIKQLLKDESVLLLLKKYGYDKHDIWDWAESSQFISFENYLEAQMQARDTDLSHFEEYVSDYEEELQEALYDSLGRCQHKSQNYLEAKGITVPEELIQRGVSSYHAKLEREFEIERQEDDFLEYVPKCNDDYCYCGQCSFEDSFEIYEETTVVYTFTTQRKQQAERREQTGRTEPTLFGEQWPILRKARVE